MPERDYYAILGVNKNASQEEIKRAFRSLAKKHHPDVAGKESEEKFKEINEAFQVLSDPQKRMQYDQFGSASFANQDFSDFKWPNFEDILNDFGFGDFFGFDRSSARSRSGKDIRYDIEISLEDAFHGITKQIEVPYAAECAACHGRGGSVKECAACHGSGELRRVQRMGLTQVVSIVSCHACNGEGKAIEKKCTVCKGDGYIQKTKKITVSIPKGVTDGSYLRVAGHGEAGKKGGSPGDLFVGIHIMPHEIFDRYDDDLYCQTEISMMQAIFGAEISVPTLTGKATLKIPSGTQSHTIFRLKGQGMPNLHHSKQGDQLIKVVVVIPKGLTAKEKRVLQEFANLREETATTKKGFFEKMKEYL
jgi:molecular chaperone DnaJ